MEPHPTDTIPDAVTASPQPLDVLDERRRTLSMEMGCGSVVRVSGALGHLHYAAHQQADRDIRTSNPDMRLALPQKVAKGSTAHQLERSLSMPADLGKENRSEGLEKKISNRSLTNLCLRASGQSSSVGTDSVALQCPVQPPPDAAQGVLADFGISGLGAQAALSDLRLTMESRGKFFGSSGHGVSAHTKWIPGPPLAPIDVSPMASPALKPLSTHATNSSGSSTPGLPQQSKRHDGSLEAAPRPAIKVGSRINDLIGRLFPSSDLDVAANIAATYQRLNDRHQQLVDEIVTRADEPASLKRKRLSNLLKKLREQGEAHPEDHNSAKRGNKPVLQTMVEIECGEDMLRSSGNEGELLASDRIFSESSDRGDAVPHEEEDGGIQSLPDGAIGIQRATREAVASSEEGPSKSEGDSDQGEFFREVTQEPSWQDTLPSESMDSDLSRDGDSQAAKAALSPEVEPPQGPIPPASPSHQDTPAIISPTSIVPLSASKLEGLTESGALSPNFPPPASASLPGAHVLLPPSVPNADLAGSIQSASPSGVSLSSLSVAVNDARVEDAMKKGGSRHRLEVADVMDMVVEQDLPAKHHVEPGVAQGELSFRSRVPVSAVTSEMSTLVSSEGECVGPQRIPMGEELEISCNGSLDGQISADSPINECVMTNPSGARPHSTSDVLEALPLDQIPRLGSGFTPLHPEPQASPDRPSSATDSRNSSITTTSASFLNFMVGLATSSRTIEMPPPMEGESRRRRRHHDSNSSKTVRFNVPSCVSHGKEDNPDPPSLTSSPSTSTRTLSDGFLESLSVEASKRAHYKVDSKFEDSLMSRGGDSVQRFPAEEVLPALTYSMFISGMSMEGVDVDRGLQTAVIQPPTRDLETVKGGSPATEADHPTQTSEEANTKRVRVAQGAPVFPSSPKRHRLPRTSTSQTLALRPEGREVTGAMDIVVDEFDVQDVLSDFWNGPSDLTMYDKTRSVGLFMDALMGNREEIGHRSGGALVGGMSSVPGVSELGSSASADKDQRHPSSVVSAPVPALRKPKVPQDGNPIGGAGTGPPTTSETISPTSGSSAFASTGTALSNENVVVRVPPAHWMTLTIRLVNLACLIGLIALFVSIIVYRFSLPLIIALLGVSVLYFIFYWFVIRRYVVVTMARTNEYQREMDGRSTRIRSTLDLCCCGLV